MSSLDPELIDTVASLMAEELERFEWQRKKYEREIDTLRRQLVEARDQAEALIEEVSALRQRMKDMESLFAACEAAEPAVKNESSVETRKIPLPSLPGHERRRWPRRTGNPVPVTIRGSWVQPIKGWVLDRSDGGLALRMDHQALPGELLKIRSSCADAFDWIDAEVCYCCPDRASFRTGIRFQRELSYPDIRQFG